jgi:hypothetical protein
MRKKISVDRNPSYLWIGHRMREMGFHNPILDLIHEETLMKDQVRDFLSVLFGTFEAPDPGHDWKGFCHVVEQLLSKEKKVYNPVHKKRIDSVKWIGSLVLCVLTVTELSRFLRVCK